MQSCFCPVLKIAVHGPAMEENLALIQTISARTAARSQVSPGCYKHLMMVSLQPTAHTPALLRLDPFWDPLRGDPAFQKLCEEKKPPATP